MTQPLICNRTWEEIQATQQKQPTAPLVARPNPTATESDIQLLEQHGVRGLERMQYYGVIDRLTTSGLI